MKRVIIASVAVLLFCGCDNEGGSKFTPRTGGDPDRGAALVAEKRCGSCHVIPGIDDAEGTVGPPLTNFAIRSFIAGEIPNTPENLVQWLMDPPEMAPHTAMPDLELTQAEAENIAAWLYTLK